MDLYNLDIPGGSGWIRIWLMLGFLFFFFHYFIFISFRSFTLPQLTTPVAVATGPQLRFYYYCYYPFPNVWSEDPADHFQIYFTLVGRYAFDVFTDTKGYTRRYGTYYGTVRMALQYPKIIGVY